MMPERAAALEGDVTAVVARLAQARMVAAWYIDAAASAAGAILARQAGDRHIAHAATWAASAGAADHAAGALGYDAASRLELSALAARMVARILEADADRADACAPLAAP